MIAASMARQRRCARTLVRGIQLAVPTRVRAQLSPL
jgi:hypothetical protein